MTPTPLGTINLGFSLAAVLIPEVVDFVKAIRALFAKHPRMTPEQVSQLASELAAQEHATYADTKATLDGIVIPKA